MNNYCLRYQELVRIDNQNYETLLLLCTRSLMREESYPIIRRKLVTYELHIFTKSAIQGIKVVTNKIMKKRR